MAMSILSVLLGLRTTAVSAIKGGWTQWKRHRARKAALEGADHRDRGAIDSLVGKGLLSLAAVGNKDLPGNVEPQPFRDWLRDSDNLADFVRVYVAHIGQQPSASQDAEARLASGEVYRHPRIDPHGAILAAPQDSYHNVSAPTQNGVRYSVDRLPQRGVSRASQAQCQ
jgi:hypothetical protein